MEQFGAYCKERGQWIKMIPGDWVRTIPNLVLLMIPCQRKKRSAMEK